MEIKNKSQERSSLAPELSIAESFKIEVEKASYSKLKQIMNKLKYICHEVDPYDCQIITHESQNILDEFHLNDSLKNPFTFTNNLLRILDITETEFNKRLH